MDSTSRRQFLTLAGTAASASLAGCGGTPVGEQGATGTHNSTDDGTGESPQHADSSVYTDVYEQAISSVGLVKAFLPEGQSQGSAWVFDEETLVTNHHVVANAEAVEVQFHDGTWAVAEIHGTDIFSDLAALDVPDAPESAAPLSLMERDPPVGKRVVAIGNPYGFEGSMSEGIVSGVNRLLPNINGVQIADTIQTDAAVNPGNSGGPLVGLDGEVVGCINSGGGENIAFAISAPMVNRVVPELVEHGDYSHAAMGISMVNVTPTVARVNELETTDGAMIVGVADGGPSDDLIQPATETTSVGGVSVPVGGDVLVAIEGAKISSQQAYAAYLALETKPGDTVTVTLLRDGQRIERTVTLGSRSGVN
ncbi:S1C family serine protease [Haloarchaeobius sp. DFWS5]|uniref:S1C family serine protease n=1 Tax=Haloarchaeobius sp. DFWS5 TaxID=3446114 RepID=UPI003EC10935